MQGRSSEIPKLRQERSLGDIVGDAFTILFSDLPVLAKLVAPAVLVGIAGSLVVYGVGSDDENLATAILYIELPLLLVAFQVVSAAVIARLNARDQGRELDSGDALDLAQEKFGDVVTASLRSTAIVFLLSATVIGLPWAIKRLVKWAFIVQSIVVDGQTSETALSYSESMVQGRWWITFGRIVACALILLLPAAILSQAISAIVPGVLGVIASHATDFVTLPFGMITSTLIFFDLKLRKGPAV
jgi:hypothetical protein